MSNFNLERIKFRWRAEWKNSVQYQKDDIVYYQGKSFVCLKGHTSANNFYDDFYANNITETFTVTVGVDTINGQSSGKYYLNGEENPELFLLKGRKYRFDQSDISNLGYNGIGPNIFGLSNTANGTLAGAPRYSSGVTYYLDNQEVPEEIYIENFATSIVRYIEVTLPETAPPRLFYFSENNNNMGSHIDSRYDSYWELKTDGYIWAGDWRSSTFYAEDTIVKYKGYLYQAITSHTSQPVDVLGLPEDIENWRVILTNKNWLNEWTTNTLYDQGDVVRYNGLTYIANTRHTSASSESDGLENDLSSWTLATRSDNWRDNWNTSVRYIVDDVVRYGGIVYRCIEGHTSAGSITDGLELDQSKWEIVTSGIEYKTEWANNTKYKLGDIVKYGASLWRCNTGHTSTSDSGALRTDEVYWDIWVPGLEYERLWDPNVEYQVGDIVLYGGYSYTALQNNTNSVPSVNGLVQNTGDWEVLSTDYIHRGDWDSAQNYRTGDVVRAGGYLYIAIADNFNTHPDSDLFSWTLLVDSTRWRDYWQEGRDYFLGDVVTYAGTTYQCINRHTSTNSADDRPDIDVTISGQDHWLLLIQGSPNNVLVDRGDIRTHQSDISRLPIGTSGTVLKSTETLLPGWLPYDETPNVYFVSLDGRDIPENGSTLSSAFRTVKYCCDYINQDIANRTPATIFVKTGVFSEILPISLPVDTALVGDELRSTIIEPAPGYEQSNMFYVRNGSGIRNMTLRGLSGTLGEPNENLTRRPSAGAFVSLDPGTGPDDNSVWITTKSCYVQNVTTFGVGCIGMKVDGALHNGGNRSIVANDFTQVLSDGIGYWADNVGRSELVSVFTYYCHIGYLCTNGGILRATNGNNSYGLYGSVAEGFDLTEDPITAKINNRDNDAQFAEAVTYGTETQKILAIGYSHAGQNYTSAEIAFGGSGINANAQYNEFRDGAISNIRVTARGDSTFPGGLNYTLTANNAQGGDSRTIILAQSDIVEEPSQYIGQRIRIASGLGVGQYGEITAYDPITKEAVISRESDGDNGWDHWQPGWPIENNLNETTFYVIEPKVTVEEPPFITTEAGSISGGSGYKFLVNGDGDNLIAVTDGSDGQPVAAHSIDGGGSWQGPNSLGSTQISGVVWTGNRYIIIQGNTNVNTYIESTNGTGFTQNTLPFTDQWRSIATDGNGGVLIVGAGGDVAISSNHGQSWSSATINGHTSQNWGLAAYGNGTYVLVDTILGDVAVSTDNGLNWTIYQDANTDYPWKDISYGNGRFVIISDAEDSTGNITRTGWSFDGITWYESLIESGDFTHISYGAGTFIASGPGSIVAKSKDGKIWRTFGDDSTSYSLTRAATWSANAFNGSNWIVIDYDTGIPNRIITGTRAIVRLSVVSSRADEFIIYDPGSFYTDVPTIEIYDNVVTADTTYQVYLNDGVLPQPEYVNRGEGYVTITGTITGNGYAEIYQTGKILKVTGMTRIPGPGANLNILGIDDRRYSVSRVNESEGPDGDITATLEIVPSLDVDESPDHGNDILIRERYSQVRLTGHDFLDIGTGNIETTRYPGLYVFGEDAENERQPFNETVAFGGGRVFYTSTDQDGNFRVGELFRVEQNTGIVTINADFFDLDGLTELSLGGIQIGGSAVVVREFSKDPNLAANSNNVVPTQRAIKAYIESRISGGGSNASTNTLVAGQVRITNNVIDTTSDFKIEIPTVMNFKGGISGHYLAVQFFSAGGAI